MDWKNRWLDSAKLNCRTRQRLLMYNTCCVIHAVYNRCKLNERLVTIIISHIGWLHSFWLLSHIATMRQHLFLLNFFSSFKSDGAHQPMFEMLARRIIVGGAFRDIPWNWTHVSPNNRFLLGFEETYFRQKATNDCSATFYDHFVDNFRENINIELKEEKLPNSWHSDIRIYHNLLTR